MKIKSIKKIILDHEIPFYDITVDNYHNFPVGINKTIVHNTSLAKSINRITKNFGNSESIFIGDGFFGSPVNPDAAAPRYTSLKINPKVKSIISEYSYLNEKIIDEYMPLHSKIPIGLFNHIIGIAIGWKTSIMPRRLEDIEKYLKGEIKSISPYFQNFQGKISKVENSKKSWLVSPKLKIDNSTFSIEIIDLPPMLKYSAFLEKLYSWADETGWNITIKNNSNEKVAIYLQLRNNRESWNKFCLDVEKMSKILITETIIFVKDNRVIEYQCIEDYLDDYKIWIDEINLKSIEYKLNVNNFEIQYNKAKAEYLNFMMEKKRNQEEIDWFISQYENERIQDRLKNIKLNQLSIQEIEKVKELISKLLTDESNMNDEKLSLFDKFEKNKSIEFKGFVAKKESEKVEIEGIDNWDIDDDDIDVDIENEDI